MIVPVHFGMRSVFASFILTKADTKLKVNRLLTYDNALLCFTSIGTFEPLTFCHKTYYGEDISSLSAIIIGMSGVGKFGFEKSEENQLSR